ncbi:MAG TPA: type II toxin-antitoxin system prevent-host-death family antitoxin [Acidimicrobiales bacterium]|nr:type II toxin-antitoxin system prevent-host-death family antitoxin [Acidimicrobiales bacterium]
MAVLTVTAAKASLSGLLERALAGEEITIGRRGKAEVRLVPVDRLDEQRQLGTIDVPDYFMSDDFDAPLDDVADDFERA